MGQPTQQRIGSHSRCRALPPLLPLPPQLGALMSEAQRVFTERAAPLCPSQLTSPVLHKVLAHPPIQAHIYGGKGVGSQVRLGRVEQGGGWSR